jgi:hypothetical protein
MEVSLKVMCTKRELRVQMEMPAGGDSLLAAEIASARRAGHPFGDAIAPRTKME